MARFEVRLVGAEYVLDTTQGLFEIDEDSVQDLYDAIDACDCTGEGSVGDWVVSETDDGYHLHTDLFVADLTSFEMDDLVRSIEALGFE
jgi:hypothetical protein